MAHSAILAQEEEAEVGTFLEKGLTDTYYKGMYDEYLDKNPNVMDLMANNNVRLSSQSVNKVLALPWSGNNYSQNIWNNSYFIAKKAQDLVAKNIIAGRSIENLTNDFAKVYGNNYRANIRRLLRTETAFVKSQADVEVYKKLGVEEYEILATLDSRTSAICQEKDGKHYPIDDIRVGVNYPPFHPNCRTTTIKYNPDYEGRTRMAKDKDGKNVKVPHNLKYKAWRKWVDSKYKENTYEALTKVEKQAIMEYKSSESFKINEKLYNNIKLNAKEKELVRNIDKALKKMPDYEGDLVRDLYFFDKNIMKDFLNAHEVGNTVNYRAYTSTTKANSYNDMANVRIYINNSKMGKDISSIGLDEEEVLYPRNSEFLVNSIRKSSNLVEIILEELSNE
ncbi:minor capsid protein [Anaerococcus tetradius]|uniref:minor capsid protein n=1 Tax=Anaerococcus tetradius TaxID=33036 RepID=UPI0023F28953|nr:minor capsid protein [Anaerococcus tetradius]